MDLILQFREPDKRLSDFVDSIWMLHNPSHHSKDVIVLPDGRIDLFFSRSENEPFHVTLLGLGTKQGLGIITPGRLTFAISFTPLGAEYVLNEAIADLPDKTRRLPVDFWGFSEKDLTDFDLFCEKAFQKLAERLPGTMDERRRKLFHLIAASNGAAAVKDLSAQVGWSSRQINRYFNEHFGVSLKAYCSILRFRASFRHIKNGELYPQENFADQSHFIKEIRRLSGVIPKELKLNRNDRFIQLSSLPPA